MEDEPVSLPAVRSGALGATGDAVSTTTVRIGEAGDVLPARSVAVMVMGWVPTARVGVNVQAPDASVVTVPISVTPS